MLACVEIAGMGLLLLAAFFMLPFKRRRWLVFTALLTCASLTPWLLPDVNDWWVPPSIVLGIFAALAAIAALLNETQEY